MFEWLFDVQLYTVTTKFEKKCITAYFLLNPFFNLKILVGIAGEGGTLHKSKVFELPKLTIWGG